MIAYGAKSRIKTILLLLVIALVLAGIGVYLYFFRNKEPTHGVFVYNTDHSIVVGEELMDYGHIYKTS